MIRDDEKATFVARKLFENNIFIIPATHPAVKLKESRLRLNVSSEHNKGELDSFCAILADINTEFKLNLTK